MASQSNPTFISTQASEHLPSVTNDFDCREQTKTPIPALYQSQRLAACAKRLIHTFTGKPLSLGGPALDQTTRLKNRQQLCHTLHLPVESIIVPDQVHSATSKYESDPDHSECDAIIVTKPNLPVMVLTADCVPVIAYDPVQHVGAVIHAGWKGTAQSITALTVQKLINTHGCQAQDIIIAIGPSISGCCYEVSNSVVEALEQTVPASSKPDWYFPQKNKNPKIDLKKVNQHQLEALGITQIDTLPNCTHCEADQFFSHRRGDTGRQGTLLMLKH